MRKSWVAPLFGCLFGLSVFVLAALPSSHADPETKNTYNVTTVNQTGGVTTAEAVVVTNKTEYEIGPAVQYVKGWAFQIRSKDGLVLRITPEGEVELGKGISISQASMKFWENLGITYKSISQEVSRLRAENVALRAMCKNQVRVRKEIKRE